MTTLVLTEDEVHAVAQSLWGRWEKLSELRCHFEQQLAKDHPSHVERSAANYEKRLADLDAVVGKLPTWVGKFMRESQALR